MFDFHHRFRIWNSNQHPFRHPASDFGYTSGALPGVTTIEGALDWILAVLYPNAKDAVATVAALPAVGNSINDYRVVLNDGDSKAASYRWEQREGDVAAKWYKVYDMDWGSDSILAAFVNKTQDMYFQKYGYDDLDYTGTAVTGTLAGQSIHGGKSANTNLTLNANSGDGTGATTGYVQVADHFRPTADSSFTCGTTAERWSMTYTDSLTSGTLVATTGSITCASGAISFGDENVSSTGTITGGVLKADNIQLDGNTISILDVDGNLTLAANGSGIITSSFPLTVKSVTATTSASTLKTGTTIGTLTLADGSISDSSDAINFGNDALTTSGAITGGQVNADNLRMDGNTLSATDVGGNVVIAANGAGVISLSSQMNGGIITSNNYISADNLKLDGNTLSSTNAGGNIILDPNGVGLIEFGAAVYPETDSSWDIGKTGNVWNKLWIDGSVGGATQEILVTELMSLRNNLFRDAARTQAVQAGDVLFWDAVSSTWLASAPDTEIHHGALTGNGDDDHTQYVLLAGRADGQAINGGANASGNLTLDSTANITKGNIIFQSILRPSGDGTIDIGTSSYPIKDLYISGQLIEARLENATTAGAPAAGAGTKGRLYFNTDENDIYVDTGGTWVKVNAEKYVNQDAVNWNGSIATYTYTVSASVSDARECIWSFKANAADFEQLGVKITMTETTVTVTAPFNLASGTYTLVGIG